MSALKRMPPLLKGDWLALFLPLLVPATLCVLVYVSAYLGNISGRLYCGVLRVSWLLIGLHFGVKMVGLLARRATPRASMMGAGLVVCFLGFGWSQSTHPFLSAFESRLRRSCDISAVQTWAVGVLNTNQGDLRLSPSVWTNWSTSSSFDQPGSIFVVSDESRSGAAHVKIIWGSGVVGQWGLIVGPSGMPKRGREWSPGVFFYVNPRPSGWRD